MPPTVDLPMPGRDALAPRIGRELAELGRARPRLAGAGRWVWRRPWTALPLAFVVFGVQGAANPDSDVFLFLAAGRRMTGPGALDVFADPGLQLGPLGILLAGVVARVADLVGVSAPFLLGAVQAVLVLVLAQVVAGRAARRGGASPAVARWVVTAVLLGAGSLAEATLMGHAEEIALGLALALAALDCADGRRWSGGVVLGLAMGTKLWAVLGLPLVLLCRRRTTALTNAVAAGVIAIGLYGPFLLWGDVRTFDFRWAVSGPSTVSLLVDTAAPLGWGFRVAQAAAVVVVASVLARRPSADPLAVVVAILAVRLLLDPVRFPYYCAPLQVVVLLWTWTSAAASVRRWRVPAVAATPLVTLAPYVVPYGIQAVAGTVALLAVLVVVLRTPSPAAVDAAP